MSGLAEATDLRLLRVNSSGQSDDFSVYSYTTGITDLVPAGEFNMFTNADSGILLTWWDIEGVDFAEHHMAITNGTGASVVTTPEGPDGKLVYPSLQAQDGSFVGTTEGGYMCAFDATGGVRWCVPGYYPQIATADGGVIATSYDSVGATIFDQNGNATGQIPNMPTQSWPGNVYLGTLGSVQSMNMLPIQWASSFVAVDGGNPSGNSTSVPFLKWIERIAFWGGGSGPKCQLGDAQVPLGGEELQGYTAKRQVLLDGGYLTCPNCLDFFTKNPAAEYFGGLTGAVSGQVPYDVNQTTISLYAAGLWTATDLLKITFPSQWLKTPVCKGFQGTSGNGNNIDIAVAQTQPPATDVYLTTKTKLWRKFLTQGLILHESLHNLTRLDDDAVEALLGLAPTASKGKPTDIINQTLEEHQCAGPPQ